MIRNRFAVLLAEKGLKITRVGKDTGISRSTLNNISKNDTDMIRLETINTLCKYLGVTHCEFFEFEPVDIEFSLEIISMKFTSQNHDSGRILRCKEFEADLLMDVKWGHSEKNIDLSCELTSELVFEENKLSQWFFEEYRVSQNPDLTIDIDLDITFDNKDDKDYFVNDIYSKLSSSFYQDIYSSLNEAIINSVLDRIRVIIDNYIDNHLDFTAFPNGANDRAFAEGLKHAINNDLSININTDVFKAF